MAENSKIEWTDHTFNPWFGCTKVSPGCDHCYAEARMDTRLHRVAWGAGQPRQRTKTWGDPVRWNKAHEAFYATHGRRQRVFCASLADVFDNEVVDEWRVDLFRLIAATPNLDWLVLTKRIGNAQRMLRTVVNSLNREGDVQPYWPWPNVWLGATIVNQEEADRDIPKLMEVPARVRFLSMEPLLGPVKFCSYTLTERPCFVCEAEDGLVERGAWSHPINCGWRHDQERAGTFRQREGHGSGIDWVIVGGESGPKARPMHPDWAGSLRDQCAGAGVPFLFKQVGDAIPVETDIGDYGHEVYPLDDTVILPADRYKLHTAGSGQYFVRVGKKAAGRLLDGVEHNGFPGAA